MAQEREFDTINKRFAYGAKQTSEDGAVRTDEQWEKVGVAQFRGAVFKRFQRKVVHSAKDLAEILVTLKVAESVKTGKNIMANLVGEQLGYWGFPAQSMTFAKASSASETFYEISRGCVEFPEY